MTKYRVKMMSGDELMIEEKEYQMLIEKGATGLVFVPSLKGTINLNSVETILHPDVVPEKEQKTGRLWDGTRVHKKFGEWVDTNSGGSVMLNYDYYPELGRDEVMTEEEYQAAKEEAAKLEAPPEVKKLKSSDDE